ncbi:MAG: dihydroxyacetone kinase subunit L [Firmicutes bacterium]|nr:dihydroxyacetone kinase subunit L [Bacillota bacterium]
MEKITRDALKKALLDITDEIEANQDYLSELDAAMGDGDHGVSMTLGWRAVAEKIKSLEDPTIADLLKTTGMALVSSVGAAMGPLYGTGFIRAAAAAGDAESLNLSQLTKVFEAFRDGVMQRGNAQVGDKTMVDTIVPAVDALKGAEESGSDLISALRAFVVAAEEGMKSTIPLQSKVGRSSRLGERTIGHQDAGATSCYLIFKTFARSVAGGSL